MNSIISIKKTLLKKVFNSPQAYRLYRYYKQLGSGVIFKKVNYPIRDIVICGMPRSGSTLLFNLIKQITLIYSQKVNTYFNYDSEYRNLLTAETSIYVKKNHRFSPLLSKRIEKKLTIGFFTHRDLRDVVVSLIQKGRITDFYEWLNRRKLRKIVNDSMLYAHTKNIILISYDDLLNNKRKIISKISAELNIQLSDEEIENLIKSSDIEKIKKQIADRRTLDVIDISTQLHSNHIKDGIVGKWKEKLNEDQIKIINEKSQDFMQFFGY